jgi:uncharacterized membrane protein YphA (DoxX/SURF4 family)
MRQTSDYFALSIRMTAGVLLIFTSFQPINSDSVHQMNPLLPLCMPSTNVMLLDVLLRGMFIGFGLFILLGVRTRLLSAFILSVTLMLGSICIQEPGGLMTNHLILFALVIALAVLILRGGGIYALRCGGWKDIPL